VGLGGLGLSAEDGQDVVLVEIGVLPGNVCGKILDTSGVARDETGTVGQGYGQGIGYRSPLYCCHCLPPFAGILFYLLVIAI
jgi:hypothetical protein